MQAVTIYGKNNIIDILNLYNPNQNISANKFINYFKQLNNSKVIVGDFNAHHQMWDTRSPNNSTGCNLISSLIDNPDLCLLTPQCLPTYYHLQSGSFSTLDLCFVLYNLYTMSSVTLEPEMRGDHEPILVVINFEPSVAKFKSRGRWLFNSRSWINWKKNFPKIVERQSFVENCENFAYSLLSVSRTELKRSKEIVNPKFAKPWLVREMCWADQVSTEM